MYDEISFLFTNNPKIDNNDNKQDIFEMGQYDLNFGKQISLQKDAKSIYLRYKQKDVSDTNSIKNFLAESSYKYSDDSNPYVKLIEDFEFTRSTYLTPQDFTYLTDLGVYPLNRLVILRRFDESVIVNHNLNDIEEPPISTLIGWLKMDEGNDMFSISFNEKWEETSEELHTLITQIIKDETTSKTNPGGFDIGQILSIPSWSQGLVFGFLNKMGLTKYDIDDLPIGDPNVLRVSTKRETERQSLDSDIEIGFETSYEQKYINGVDPGSAMLDVFHNVLRMGTSDMNFVLNQTKITEDFYKAAVGYQDTSLGKWGNLVRNMVQKLVETFDELMKDSGKILSEFGLDKAFETASKLLTSILRKYRWGLRGSIGLMSGLHTTPWHLTVGNPYNPILSIGNMLVNDISVGWSNDLGFNDMPNKINVKVKLKFGRPLGKQEIMQIFNNGYGRKYSDPNEQKKNEPTPVNTNPNTSKVKENVGDAYSPRPSNNDPYKKQPTTGIGNRQSSILRDTF